MVGYASNGEFIAQTLLYYTSIYAVLLCINGSFFYVHLSFLYCRKMLLPLPAPIGLVCLGRWYLLLTSFCFVSMGNGVNLTDGLDGLAGGAAALAFIGMSIAVLPICSG